jgi:hypothetical protein
MTRYSNYKNLQEGYLDNTKSIITKSIITKSEIREDYDYGKCIRDKVFVEQMTLYRCKGGFLNNQYTDFLTCKLFGGNLDKTQSTTKKIDPTFSGNYFKDPKTGKVCAVTDVKNNSCPANKDACDDVRIIAGKTTNPSNRSIVGNNVKSLFDCYNKMDHSGVDKGVEYDSVGKTCATFTPTSFREDTLKDSPNKLIAINRSIN